MIDTLYSRLKHDEPSLEELKEYVEDTSLLEHVENEPNATELAALSVNTTKRFRAHRVLILAHAFGCRFKQGAYERVAYQMTQTRKWAQIPALVALGQRQTGKTTTRLLNWRTRALVEISHYRLLDHVLSDFEEANIQPTRRTYQTLVSGHLRNHDFDKAAECLEWMQDAGFPMDASTHAMLANGVRSLGPDPRVKDRAIASLPSMSAKQGTMTLNGLIQMAADTGDMEGIRRYFSHFDPPAGNSVTTYTQPVYETDVDTTSVMSPHHPQLRRDLLPDVYTFTILLHYAAKSRDHSFGSRTVDTINAYGVYPDSAMAAALIRLHCSTGRFSTALDIAATMCQDMDRAQGCLRDLGWGGQYFTLVPLTMSHSSQTVSALLDGILQYRGLKGMYTANRFILAVNLKHDTRTVEAFTSYLAKTKCIRPRDLIRLLHAFQRSIPPTSRQVRIIYNAVLREQRAFATRNGWENIAAFFRARHKADVQHPVLKSSPFGLKRVAETSAPSSYRALIQPIIRFLSKRQVLPSKAAMQMQLRQEGIVVGNLEAAKQTFDAMVKGGMYPTVYHYATMIESHCRAEDMQGAEEVFRRARRDGLGNDPAMYTILIHGYARLGMVGHATRMFEQMLLRRVSPDVGAVDALASAYFIVGRQGIARQTLLDHWNLFAPFPPELEDAELKVLAEEFRKLDVRSKNPWAKHRRPQKDADLAHLQARMRSIVGLYRKQRRYANKSFSVLRAATRRLRSKNSVHA